MTSRKNLLSKPLRKIYPLVLIIGSAIAALASMNVIYPFLTTVAITGLLLPVALLAVEGYKELKLLKKFEENGFL